MVEHLQKILLKTRLINYIETKFYDTYDIILIGHYHFTEIIV